MKKISLLAVIAALTAACSSSKNTMDGWVGKTKQSFIKSWGPSIRTLNTETNGEILIYADQVYSNPDNRHNSEDSNYWNYTYVYVNTDGKVASWRKERQVFPPQQISAVDLINKNSISSK